MSCAADREVRAGSGHPYAMEYLWVQIHALPMQGTTEAPQSSWFLSDIAFIPWKSSAQGQGS